MNKTLKIILTIFVTIIALGLIASLLLDLVWTEWGRATIFSGIFSILLVFVLLAGVVVSWKIALKKNYTFSSIPRWLMWLFFAILIFIVLDTLFDLPFTTV